jgi:predicted dienelactone hydrolase
MMRPARFCAALVGLLLLPGVAAASVGFQLLSVTDPENRPIELGIWYPSDSPAKPEAGDALIPQTVARDGRLVGEHLPLVIISHGSGGWLGGHADSARALAEAGYVAAAPTHAGDNYKDRSGFGTLEVVAGRPREIKRVIDFMLGSWAGHERIDAGRIGMFGFSAGGYTALIAIGGVPNVERFAVYCREEPDEPECRRQTQRRTAIDKPPESVWTHDPRIKAAVVADPGLGFLFDRAGLARVTATVQLWNASADEVVGPHSTEFVRASLPSPPDYHMVDGAGHFIYLAPCEAAVDYCKDKPGFDRARFHRDFNAAMIAFFGAVLRAL